MFPQSKRSTLKGIFFLLLEEARANQGPFKRNQTFYFRITITGRHCIPLTPGVESFVFQAGWLEQVPGLCFACLSPIGPARDQQSAEGDISHLKGGGKRYTTVRPKLFHTQLGENRTAPPHPQKKIYVPPHLARFCCWHRFERFTFVSRIQCAVG